MSPADSSSLKYISDAFEERREKIRGELSDPESAWHVSEPKLLEEELENSDAEGGEVA